MFLIDCDWIISQSLPFVNRFQTFFKNISETVKFAHYRCTYKEIHYPVMTMSAPVGYSALRGSFQQHFSIRMCKIIQQSKRLFKTFLVKNNRFSFFELPYWDSPLKTCASESKEKDFYGFITLMKLNISSGPSSGSCSSSSGISWSGLKYSHQNWSIWKPHLFT